MKKHRRSKLYKLTLLGLAACLAAPGLAAAATVGADVVMLDHVLVFNRLGAQNVRGTIYALERDLVDATTLAPCGNGAAAGTNCTAGNTILRPDKRPRPLVLRVSAGDTLVVRFTNLLQPLPIPNPLLPDEANPCVGCDGANPLRVLDNMVADRHASFYVQGMQLDGGDNPVYVGTGDANGVPNLGGTATYRYLAEKEGTFLVTSMGATFGGEATGGNVGVGAMGSVNVQPAGANSYRSQVTEEELRLAADCDGDGVLTGGELTPDGQPVLAYPGTGVCGYEARYPNVAPWSLEGKGGLPILNMIDSASNSIVHADINAIVAYGGAAGPMFPASTYPLEASSQRNPTVPNRLEPYREFTIIFHDETAAANAFPAWFRADVNPVIAHTTHGVRDSFMINYGSGGIGSEIIANRLGVGPMWDCLDCAYEEFFLTAFAVGDPAMLVDVPANIGLEQCGPDLNPAQCAAVGPKASVAFYPDDPSNVHHSYTGDFVKFRNLHAGPKEQHIFHLHNHQWLFNANDDNSNYLDAQGIGPGSGYTYEINFGGSGNRNKTAGDAIFHCHFYPHFAQGMWEMWRIHDTLETGTPLAVTQIAPGVFHDKPFALKSGLPACVNAPGGVCLERARSLPDGEIIDGTPIPAVVPLPGKPMAPMPAPVTVVAKNANPGVDDVPDDLSCATDPTGPTCGIQELAESSQANVTRILNADGFPDNPGFPFWIAGVDCGGAGKVDPATMRCDDGIVGQRPSTPPLDMLTVDDAIALKGVAGNPLFSNNPALEQSAGGFDGGLPRHALDGFVAVDDPAVPGLRDPAVVEQIQTRFDFRKVIHKAKPVYFPEEGTDLEQGAMAFHGLQRTHATFLPDGSAGAFVVNGALPVAGAPFNEPCIDDQGTLFTGAGQFFASPGFFTSPAPEYGALNPRVYKGANIQIDAVFNKVGYHFPQQRIISLWEDVAAFEQQIKPPEPFVIRMNTFDCTQYYHANLVPHEYELDDYQVRTPTDIIGQHIHLPKWDLVSADGSGNGWNYEDGTLSPGMVHERIVAINHYNDDVRFTPIPTLPRPGGTCPPGGCPATLTEQPHPFFGEPGARTTIQRWFADPVVNIAEEDRGLGIIFTHDHYGPSTHQQVGLYATVLTEPAGSKWRHNETGEMLAVRGDGGPTSWQVQITDFAAGGPGQPASAEPYREFYFEFGDFQHAYEAGAPGIIGADNCTAVSCPGFEDTFRQAINPSFRQEAGLPDLVLFPNVCPGGVPRPCPEAISADDVGMLVVNYRNEPIGLRVYDPNQPGPDGKLGSQAQPADVNLDGVIDAGEAVRGDLGWALASVVRDPLDPNGGGVAIPRAIQQMNLSPAQLAGTVVVPGISKFTDQTLNAPGAVGGGDPFTPMLRTYPGDLVRIKIQAGATEHEHSATIHGVKWLQGGSGHGAAPNSGWRNAQSDGISEQFTFTAPVNSDVQNLTGHADYAYAVDSSQDGWWSGTWGILRNYEGAQADLQPLPGGLTNQPQVANRRDFAGVCPAANPGRPPGQLVPANLRPYSVVAITANELLGNPLGATLIPGDASATMHVGGPLNPAGGTLVYNPRSAQAAFQGPLHDPTALLFVNVDDLTPLNGFRPNRQPVDAACRDSNQRPGVANPACPVRLKDGVGPEPLILRAAAGDCVEVTLFNRLGVDIPDLAGYNTLLQMVLRDRAGVNGVTTFQNNLIRPSSWVGIHPQLVEYDVSRHDGACVGLNACGDGRNVVGPVNPDGTLAPAVTYRWYAGDIAYDHASNLLTATPIEFGGVNLMPADKIKQGQKAMVGALVIEPADSTWVEDGYTNVATNGQPECDPAAASGCSRASATVNGTMRDFAVVFQKGLNHRYGDGSPVENIASEGGTIPEDSHDAGQKAINYGTEPAWYRFGLRANAQFGRGPGQLGAVTNAFEFYSNALAGGDPATPVFTASAGQEVRMRLLEPTGVGRGTTFDLHGHLWQRDPYLAGTVPSQTIGFNPLGFYLGGQESVQPAQHFDIVLPSAGGAAEQPGDYLFRDHGSFGNTEGLWGILRVAGP